MGLSGGMGQIGSSASIGPPPFSSCSTIVASASFPTFAIKQAVPPQLCYPIAWFAPFPPKLTDIL